MAKEAYHPETKAEKAERHNKHFIPSEQKQKNNLQKLARFQQQTATERLAAATAICTEMLSVMNSYMPTVMGTTLNLTSSHQDTRILIDLSSLKKHPTHDILGRRSPLDQTRSKNQEFDKLYIVAHAVRDQACNVMNSFMPAVSGTTKIVSINHQQARIEIDLVSLKQDLKAKDITHDNGYLRLSPK